ncbi:MAG TPA: FAD-binding oxidoreductase [Acidimicrobiales bacterium]|nr:FAD-binding oxidoreductase [Acidimicrobiales bacterium]
MTVVEVPSLLLPADEDLSAPLPASTDVVVIGGGLAGCALAYYLAKCGVEVVLLERGELNREASGTNAGSFHFQIALHQLTGSGVESDRARLLGDVRLLAAAAEVWSGLEGELGADLGVHVTGGLMVAETADELETLVTKQRIEQEAGLSTEVLTGAELRNFAPYLAEGVSGACYCAREGHANPLLAAPAFAARAIEAGGRARTHATVIGIQQDGTRPLSRFKVLTTAGSIEAHRVVNAAGAWAREIAGLCGLDLPVRAEGLHVNVTEPRERVLTPMVQHIGRRLTLKQAANGTFIIGGGWPARPERAPLRYSVRWQSAAGNAAVAVRVMPALADVRVMHMWTGVWASSDDLMPIVGEFAQCPGYFACVAPTGFTLGPIVAQMLAEAMAGRSPGGLPAEFRPEREVALARN